MRFAKHHAHWFERIWAVKGSDPGFSHPLFMVLDLQQLFSAK